MNAPAHPPHKRKSSRRSGPSTEPAQIGNRWTRRLLDLIWRIANNRLVYFIVTFAGLVIATFDVISAWLPKSVIHQIPPSVQMWLAIRVQSVDLKMPQPFMQGVVQSGVASLWFAWTVYLNRRWIRTMFQPPPVRLLAPMSVSVTPVIVGRERNIWDDHGINLHLDFSSTGNRALEELRDGNCRMAIAGDYVISRFFRTVQDWLSDPYFVLPFAHIRNEIKLLVPPGSAASGAGARTAAVTLDDLRQKRIAFWPESIHEEFLKKIDLDCICSMNGSVPQSSSALINFMAQTSSGWADACVLVEPYFIAFENAHYEPVTTVSDLDWYMCMVMKRELLLEYPELARRLPRAVAQACRTVNSGWDAAMEACAHYVLQEFTGINDSSLKATFNRDNVKFGIPSRADFTKRVTTLVDYPNEVGRGAQVFQYRPECLLL